MTNDKIKSASSYRRFNLSSIIVIMILLFLTQCRGPSTEDLKAVDYTPLSDNEWDVSTPGEQGLDPMSVAQLYYDASELETIYSLLVFKNGYLIAEDYFNVGSVEQKINIHSVTKSINSSLVGIAIQKGYIAGLDQKMMDFFPELADKITDPRKKQITIRQMLQMRAGYPWEESTEELFGLLMHGFRPSNLVDVPLAYDPGTDCVYSNLTAHLLGVIVARASKTDLKSFAEKYLFTPLDIHPGFWQTDWEGNYLGFSDLHLSAYDMAKFGLMYQNDGFYSGRQIVPADWVHTSLQVYSEEPWKFRVGSNWSDNAYGYQWWSIHAGDYRYSLAWGHGGEQIALIDELNMVIVVTADPLHKKHGDEAWSLEKDNLNLVADFVASLPEQHESTMAE